MLLRKKQIIEAYQYSGKQEDIDLIQQKFPFLNTINIYKKQNRVLIWSIWVYGEGLVAVNPSDYICSVDKDIFILSSYQVKLLYEVVC